MHKLITKSSNGMLKLVEVGQAEDQAQWYTLAEKCKSFANRAERGDIVTITSKGENGKRLITFIKKESAESNSLETSSGSEYKNSGWSKEEKETWSKVEAERKNRQGTLGAVATIISSLGFTKDDSVDEIVKFASDLYDKLSAKFSGQESLNISHDLLSPKKEDKKEDDDLLGGDPIDLSDEPTLEELPLQPTEDEIPF